MDFTFDARNNLLVAYSLGTDYIPTLETFSSTDYTRLSKITLTTKTAYVSPICFSNNKLYLSMYHLNGSYTEIYKWENQVLTPISNPLAPTLKAKGEYLTVNPSDQPVVYFDFGYAEIRRSGYTGTDWEITKEALAPTLYAKSSAVIGRNDVLLYTSSAFNTSIQIRVPHVITALQGKAEQPVTDKVRFLNNSFFFSEAAEVEVFDLTGKKVVSAVGIEVSLRLLPPQLYVYRAVLHSENFSGKVVVVKE